MSRRSSENQYEIASFQLSGSHSLFTIHYSFSNSSFNTPLTTSMVSCSRSLLLSSTSAVDFYTLQPVSQPIRFNSSMTHVSISSLNSSRSISNPSSSSSLSRYTSSSKPVSSLASL